MNFWSFLLFKAFFPWFFHVFRAFRFLVVICHFLVLLFFLLFFFSVVYFHFLPFYCTNLLACRLVFFLCFALFLVLVFLFFLIAVSPCFFNLFLHVIFYLLNRF